MLSKTKYVNWVPVAHACNPHYSEGRDQEGHGLKLTQEIVCETLSQKSPLQKRAGRMTQVVGPKFKPQYCKIKKEKKNDQQSSSIGRTPIQQA
jgi:hypothetical protein